MVDFKDMLNRKLASVVLDASRDVITFAFQDGLTRAFSVEGDCCSHSWIEHLEMPGDIVGATLLSVDDSAPVTQDHNEHDEARGGEFIEVYNTSFKTDRGEIVLEYRNSSNGYYGGYLTDVL
jgi:hypothetical protein